jgi:glycosyltransferase involved in cell wall biosynthesis
VSETPISVVIPVRNAEAVIGDALRSVYASTRAPREVIVVDDGCKDRTIEVARAFPVRVVASEAPGGVAAARNTGAAAASGPVLFFLDADVVLEPGALAAAARAMEDPDVTVAIGLQSPRSFFRNPASVYKNYWLHYTYRKRADRVAVIYSSAVGIRRGPFERVGGFDPNYRTPNIEDSDLGKRITEAGYRVAVVPDLMFQHIKRYSVAGMFRTDFRRTAGMTKVQLRDRFRRILRENYSSIPTSFLVSCLAPWAAALALAAGRPLAALAFLPGSVLLLNAHWLADLARSQGARFALFGALFLHLDVFAVNAGALWGMLTYALGRKY